MQIWDETVSYKEGEDLWGEPGLTSFQSSSGKLSLRTCRVSLPLSLSTSDLPTYCEVLPRSANTDGLGGLEGEVRRATACASARAHVCT